ncbi:helix-turn-helix domain-containing protein [Lactococcus lactis]|uniref:Transcriptional regulator with XRE-family HTH domain n=1 Tax=Lactococcus lactis TaxID=1358 RepID=A0AAW5TKQ4_9LACT|nr:helix-turn-helix transcriptional regulator [Lactococcus lactis]MCW2279907.1 transcriptional regulator with XRE-family HTH domain [Lactococcus lactis]
MTIFEQIKSLAKSRNITMKDLALKLGFSENLFYTWKKTNPKAADLEKVADYFHVSVDYLLGREEKEELPELTVDQILDSVENYSGGELNDSDREILRIIIEAKKAAIEKENKK